MKNKTIARRNLPPRAPVGLTAVAFLLLDRFHASDAMWGAAGVILAGIWIVFFYACFHTEQINLFNKERLYDEVSFKPEVRR